MRVGVPTEVKAAERRVGLIPSSVAELVRAGHEVVVQAGAGTGAGFDDTQYEAVGAQIAPDASAVFGTSDMIVKVKEPQAPERQMLRPGQILFTYLHLAPDEEQTRDLVASGATCVAYETVTGRTGGLPLLAPMSQVAGRMATQAGAHHLESPQGGAGILMGGVPGVPGADVVVIGGGVVGVNAAEIAIGMGARVTLLDINVEVLDRLEQRWGAAITTRASTSLALDAAIVNADLVIGAVLIPGARAPKLVTTAHIEAMRPGSVVVDVAIDQGGSFETSRPTTHDDPTFVVDGVVHYCVANMPGAVPRTSAQALNNVTLPYTLAIANHGVVEALRRSDHLRDGLNVAAGQVTEPHVAEAQGYDYVSPVTVLDDISDGPS